MASRLSEIFEDKRLVDKIKNKLPYLFTIAEVESSRAGKIGMEVGSPREKILIALLIYKFGERNLDTAIPITRPEIDVLLFGDPVSIKTITGAGGVKVSWTVDAESAQAFARGYNPIADILLVQIRWDMAEEKISRGDHPGGLFLIPVEAQKRVMEILGKEAYLSLPKPGTNPRGVEISRKALGMLLQDQATQSIKIMWKHTAIEYDPYRRWVDYWREEGNGT